MTKLWLYLRFFIWDLTTSRRIQNEPLFLDYPMAKKLIYLYVLSFIDHNSTFYINGTFYMLLHWTDEFLLFLLSILQCGNLNLFGNFLLFPHLLKLTSKCQRMLFFRQTLLYLHINLELKYKTILENILKPNALYNLLFKIKFTRILDNIATCIVKWKKTQLFLIQ